MLAACSYPTDRAVAALRCCGAAILRYCDTAVHHDGICFNQCSKYSDVSIFPRETSPIK